MSKYTVHVRKTFVKNYEVEAKSLSSAIRLITAEYEDGLIDMSDAKYEGIRIEGDFAVKDDMRTDLTNKEKVMRWLANRRASGDTEVFTRHDIVVGAGIKSDAVLHNVIIRNEDLRQLLDSMIVGKVPRTWYRINLRTENNNERNSNV